MARPLSTNKTTVNLAPGEVRVSKIRRDPPPAGPARLTVPSRERDQSDVIVGVLAFTLAVFVIVLAIGQYSGWSAGDYTWQMR